jgi:hypothetical protein
MEEKQFESSYLDKGIYDNDTQELILVFKYGKPRKFFDVPQTVWNELKESESSGSFFHSNIKKVFEYSEWQA